MKVKLQNAAPAPSREDLAHYREAIEEQVRDWAKKGRVCDGNSKLSITYEVWFAMILHKKKHPNKAVLFGHFRSAIRQQSVITFFCSGIFVLTLEPPSKYLNNRRAHCSQGRHSEVL